MLEVQKPGETLIASLRCFTFIIIKTFLNFFWTWNGVRLREISERLYFKSLVLNNLGLVLNETENRDGYMSIKLHLDFHNLHKYVEIISSICFASIWNGNA